jgi:hypothetical protein
MASNDMKTATLAGQLLHFAQSVDIVDDGTFEASPTPTRSAGLSTRWTPDIFARSSDGFP